MERNDIENHERFNLMRTVPQLFSNKIKSFMDMSWSVNKIAAHGLFVLLLSSCQQKEKPASQPNVLFIAIDDLNDWTGFMGGHPQARTPKMDRLASHSTVFTNAYCSSPACGPSRTSLLYGIQTYKSGSYGHHEVYNPNNLPVFSSLKTIPALFRQQGYYTAGSGKIFHYAQDNEDFEVYYKPKNGRVFPNPKNSESYIPKGKRPYSDFQFGPISTENEHKIHDKQYADWAVDQLGIKHDKPFFLAVGFEKPHLPWVAPQSYFDQFDLDSIELPELLDGDFEDLPEEGKIFAHNIFGFFHLEPNEHQHIISQPGLWKRLIKAYLACIAHTDAMVGRVVDALNESPYRDNTIIVLWSDHGWHLGEKEHWRKMSLWAQGSRAPLVIHLPGKDQHEQITRPVSLQNIYPTLVDLCGLKTDQLMDGHSLGPLLSDPGNDWQYPAIISHGPGNFAVCLREWRYIQYYKGGQELYNIKDDPNEYNNLADDEKYKAVIDELRSHVPTEYTTLLGPRFKAFYK
jgi:arylsulfatase A-like enzyme